jgi:uncharacterized membrane protein
VSADQAQAPPSPVAPFAPGDGMATIVERNIEALRREAKQREAARGWSERVADLITRFAGSMAFVFIHLALFGVWIAANLGLLPLPQWDPTFVMLGMVASVEAIFLSTFILISQNAMSRAAERRAELDLQVNLLAEHEVTKLVEMVAAIGRKLDAPAVEDPEVREAAQDIRPEQVMRQIDQGRED